ncbi:phosphotransferase [Candidatus Woesearchaeota archaeon]|nr:phosphotransferase [Candidatus Woesearchaeota archaeon]
MKNPENYAKILEKAIKYMSLNFSIKYLKPVCAPCVNYTFLASKCKDSVPEMVLKIKDGNSSNFNRERQAMQLYNAVGVPVPTEIHFDNSYDYWNTEIIIYEFIPNKPVNPDKFPYKQMGYTMSIMHRIAGNGFGLIDPDSWIGTNKTWEEFLYLRASNGKRKNLTENYLGVKINNFLKNIGELDLVPKPRLLHLDYNPANVILGNNNQLYVIDPVGALGDPLMDVANSIINLEDYERKEFLLGYHYDMELSPKEIEALSIYETVAILNKLGNVLTYKEELKCKSLEDTITHWLDGKVESWLERERRYLKRLDVLYPKLMSERKYI